MLADASFVVAALSSGHKIGLAAVGAAFIVFALVSSFVLPRRNPNFPGRHLALYLTICALFFVAMLAAVLVFGRESSEAAKGGEASAHTSTPATTTTQAPAPSGGGTTQGDAAAGRSVFDSAGCAGCHTLKAAGSKGNVGPNLDTAKPSEARVKAQVLRGGGAMPSFKGQLSAKQIQDVAAFVSASTHS